jgi:hypothetical protein
MNNSSTSTHLPEHTVTRAFPLYLRGRVNTVYFERYGTRSSRHAVTPV